MAGARVPFADLEFDLVVSSFPRPTRRPFDERLPDSLPTMVRGHPNVVDERVGLLGQEAALAEDQVPEEFPGRPLGDPLLGPVSFDEALDLPPEVLFPFPAVEPLPLVLGEIVPGRLQGRRPDPGEVRGARGAHAKVDRLPSRAAPRRPPMKVSSSGPRTCLSRPSFSTQNL